LIGPASFHVTPPLSSVCVTFATARSPREVVTVQRKVPPFSALMSSGQLTDSIVKPVRSARVF